MSSDSVYLGVGESLFDVARRALGKYATEERVAEFALRLLSGPRLSYGGIGILDKAGISLIAVDDCYGIDYGNPGNFVPVPNVTATYRNCPSCGQMYPLGSFVGGCPSCGAPYGV